MTHTSFIRTVLLGILLIPSVAMAYTSPEEELSSPENYRFFNPPPSPRNAQDAQAYQQSSTAARRERDQQAIFGGTAAVVTPEPEPVEEEPVHDAADTGSDHELLQQLLDKLSNEEDAVQDTVDNRILDRLRQQQLLADYNAQAAALAAQFPQQNQSLHSGAPLSETGPATAAGIVVLAGAAYWTFRKARSLEK